MGGGVEWLGGWGWQGWWSLGEWVARVAELVMVGVVVGKWLGWHGWWRLCEQVPREAESVVVSAGWMGGLPRVVVAGRVSAVGKVGGGDLWWWWMWAADVVVGEDVSVGSAKSLWGLGQRFVGAAPKARESWQPHPVVCRHTQHIHDFT